MSARSRRVPRFARPVEDEGPFASFTDLFIGILFLFLILVAALMLMHQQAVHTEKVETVQPVQPKPEPPPKPVPEQPAFRLGIVFNIYQRPAVFDGEGWTYSRTVRVFRSPDGRCINTVWMRSNLSTAWMSPTAKEDIPTGDEKDALGRFEPCGLSASGDRWETASEAGQLKRITPYLYSGSVVLHKKEGDETLEMQYRVLGVYDDYFRAPTPSAKPG
ncbi:MAG: hypothetical protein ACJ798_12320 [Phenylobacterium sp.]